MCMFHMEHRSLSDGFAQGYFQIAQTSLWGVVSMLNTSSENTVFQNTSGTKVDSHDYFLAGIKKPAQRRAIIFQRRIGNPTTSAGLLSRAGGRERRCKASHFGGGWGFFPEEARIVQDSLQRGMLCC